ncbi:hypothetical protein WMF26_24770 [Sorangium sp. So ce185]|uniref:hypothetical protein n=1 Tax=Sorangium sp. So ce185 TaxID=3133287 RepID=UPI003F5F36A4
MDSRLAAKERRRSRPSEIPWCIVADVAIPWTALGSAIPQRSQARRMRSVSSAAIAPA